MKLTAVFFMVASLGVSAKGFSQTVTFTGKSVPLKKVFSVIEQQTGYTFFYNNAAIDKEATVTVSLKKSSLETALDKVLKGHELSYLIQGKTIFIRANPVTAGGIVPVAQEEESLNIHGQVRDESGNPLIGVTVALKGTSTGTITDTEGNYSLDLPNNSGTLVFSSVGYQKQEIVVNDHTVINVTMKAAATSLDRLVVIGYGTARKKDLTGAVSSVGEKAIRERPVPSLGQALQGNVPGVMVRTQSAAPGGGVQITIRGHNSINSNSSPLYVVDGMPTDNIDNLPVEDIESVEVLKDASSTAIYGARGANGVVLITTQKGELGQIHISYNGNVTFQRLANRVHLMDARQFADIYTQWEKAVTPGITPSRLYYNGSSYDRPGLDGLGKGTDWYKVITQEGYIQNHQVSINGGTEKNRFAISLTDRYNRGLIRGGNYSRQTIDISDSYTINSWISSDVHIFLSKDQTNSSGDNVGLEGGGSSPIAAAYKMPPTLPVYNPDGGYQANSFPGSQDLENPLAAAIAYTNLSRNNTTIANFDLLITPLNGLSFKIMGGANLQNNNYYNYNPSTTINGALLNGQASQRNATSAYYLNEELVTYQKQLDKNNYINAVGGFTYEQETDQGFSASSSDFFTDEFSYNNLGAASNFGKPGSNKTMWELASFLGRINYSFADKYLLTLSGRYDGSSRFGADNKWGFFPSVAAAWRISNESFMKSINAISDLKLRASWGKAGNANIGLYQSQATLSLANYPFGGSINSGVAASNLPNPGLKWETTVSKDLGIDLGLFNRINFTVDAYYKRTNDLLMNVSLIETSGFSNALRNVGVMDNKGLEFDVNAKVVEKPDFSWGVNGSLFLNRNKIIRLNGDASQNWKIGHPIGVERMYKITGIVRNEADLKAYSDVDGNPIGGAKLGDYEAQDFNHDGVIDAKDMQILFNPNPKFSYSLRSDFKYKNFDLSIFIYGTHGNQVLNLNHHYFTKLDAIRNVLSTAVLNNYWTPENPNAEYAALGSISYERWASPNGGGYIDVQNGSFLRLQSVVLSYKLPMTKIYDNASVYISGQNLFTITKYKGLNPDVSSNSGNTNFGVDRASYPFPISYTIGLKVSF